MRSQFCDFCAPYLFVRRKIEQSTREFGNPESIPARFGGTKAVTCMIIFSPAQRADVSVTLVGQFIS